MRVKFRVSNAVRRLTVVGGVIAVTAGGIFGSMAFADNSRPQMPSPAGVAAAPGGVAAAPTIPNYPKNASGLRYGSLEDASSPDQAPDLILVQDTKGAIGYVLRTDLDAATGANVATPAEAVVWQARQDARAAAGKTITIAVYQSDGKTRIGGFVIAPSKPH